MAVILDGAKVAGEIKQEIRKKVDMLLEADYARRPHLSVILVGENPASQVYVRAKERDCQECGFSQETIRLPADTGRGTLLDTINRLNDNPGVDGILVQLPLPKGLDEWAMLEEIVPTKDVDCFHPLNVGKVAIGTPEFVPCTPKGVMRLLLEYGIPVAGKNCVVLGRSNIVGKPMAQLLTAADGTVSLCHSKTENLEVVDVAMNRGADGKLCGDVDFKSVEPKASYITPVPGGIGPMTRAMLMENVLRAWEAF